MRYSASRLSTGADFEPTLSQGLEAKRGIGTITIAMDRCR